MTGGWEWRVCQENYNPPWVEHPTQGMYLVYSGQRLCTYPTTNPEELIVFLGVWSTKLPAKVFGPVVPYKSVADQKTDGEFIDYS